jgi:hypothetical protein
MGILHEPQASTIWNQKQSEDLWDPCKLLEIVNPDRGNFTCVGYAPSQRRRCRNPIAGRNRNEVYSRLDAIARLEPGSKAAAADLREIAARSLCVGYHQEQAGSVAAKWQQRINTTQVSKTPQKCVIDVESDSDNEPANKEETYRSMSPKEMQEYISEILERALRTEGIRRVRERRESDRKEREHLERERLERERLERERQEKERQEKEQKQKEQEMKEQKQKKQEERERQEKERQEKERQEKERMEKEQEKWALAWDTYTKRWAAFNSLSLHHLPGRFVN